MYDRVTIFPPGPWAANASLGAPAYKTPKKIDNSIYLIDFFYKLCIYLFYSRINFYRSF